MTIPHLDPCLNPARYTTALTPLPTISNRGEYTLAAVSVLRTNINNITEEARLNPLSAAVAKYGQSFYDTANFITADFLQRDYIKLIIPQNENLNNRIQRGTITPFEIAQFISDYLYTPNRLEQLCNTNGPFVCSQLNDFFNSEGYAKSVMGGFCSLVPGVFAAIGGFFNLIGQLDGLIQDALSFLSKIKNWESEIKALFDAIKVKALIEALKEKIAKVVEGVLNKVKGIIENFSLDGALNNLNAWMQQNIGARLQKLKEEIGKFFTKENMDRILESIKQNIDYAVSLFENPTIEEIQFLILRFCGLAGGIEALINGLKDPLDDFVDNFERAQITISAADNRVTAAVVDAGGIRMPYTERQRLIDTAIEAWNPEQYIVPINEAELEDLNIWDKLENDTHPFLTIRGTRWSTVLGRDGWTRMDPAFRVLLMRTIREARREGVVGSGDKVLLNSGWRSVEYNASLDGASPTSNHLRGHAADLSWPTFSISGSNPTIIGFVNIATRNGIPGSGFYRSFIHVSTSPRELFDRTGLFNR